MAEEEPTKDRSPWPIIFLLGIIFLPGGFLAFALWAMLRWGRQRPSVVGLVAAVVSVISLITIVITYGQISSGVDGLMSDFNGDSLGQVALLLVPIWVGVSLVVGALSGWGFTIYSSRQMKKNPYLTKLAGSWRHNFKYRRTPWEYLARKKSIRALKNALLVEEEKAPMGLDEKTDEVVYRYDSEARKHTFMTGASGSGKALHAATLIPTLNGFKRVGRIRVGDMLLDPRGVPTKVLGIYQPMTKDHYEIVFSNGEVIKACGDHLWTVKEAGGDLEPQVISTRKIAENPSNWYITPLRSPVQTVERNQANSYLLGAWIAGGAPEHGTILKRDDFSKELTTHYESFVNELKAHGWLNEDGSVNSLDFDAVMTSVSSREFMVQGAVSVAGSYTLNGQTKLSFPDKECAEFMRSVIFSLGIQASQLEEYEGAHSFRFSHKPAKKNRSNQFSVSVGAITRKGAPTRGLIKIISVKPIEDNPEHYFCFEVDSKDHMFLVGRSFTPTHNTITMQSLIYSDIEVGKTVVVIDFKRSPKFAAKLAAWAEDHGREFYHFVNGDPENYDIPRSKGQCTYDPLKSGDTTAKADMVLGMREYDSNAAVYESAMQQLLQVTFAMLKNGDPRRQLNREIGKEALSRTRTIDWRHGGINQLASVVTGNGFYELVAANSIELASGQKGYPVEIPGKQDRDGNQKLSYVNSPTAKNAIELGEALRAKGPLTQAFQELQGQMRTIIASEYGRWMRTGGEDDQREIDLLNLTSQEGNVILFSLNSDSEPKFAQYVGSMIFSDLTNISAARRNIGADNQVNIYVDEFQAVPPSAVTSLLEKSRESKMAMTIAQQSFDQVVASAEKAGEAYLNSILDTCSNFIAHAGATEKSAIRLAEILGKEFVTVYSKTNESDSSFLSTNWSRYQSSKVAAREEERWKFPPAEFMKLSSPDPANGFKSSAVWVTKTSADPNYSQHGGATARPVWMIPPEPVLVEYYQGVSEKPRVRKRPGSTEDQFSFDSPEETVDDHNLEVPELSSAEERSARLKKAQELASYEVEYGEEDYEDENEDWGYEEIPDDELEVQEEETFTNPPSSLAPPQPKSFDLDDLFSGGAMPDITPREEKRADKTPKPKAPESLPTLPEVKPEPRKATGGLPTRPGSGLPVRRPSSPDEDSPLPNL